MHVSLIFTTASAACKFSMIIIILEQWGLQTVILLWKCMGQSSCHFLEASCTYTHSSHVNCHFFLNHISASLLPLPLPSCLHLSQMKVRIVTTTMLPNKTTTPATIPTTIPVTATLLPPPRAEKRGEEEGDERRREVKCKGEEGVGGTEEGVVRWTE